MIETTSLFDELVKQGAITDEQAEAALRRYEALDNNQQTLGQVGRYAGLGAVAAPAIGALANVVRGGKAKDMTWLGHLAGAKTPTFTGAMRGFASNSVKGALGSGAIPLARQALDRHAEMSTLKKYIQEHEAPQEPQLHQGQLSAPFEPVEKLSFQTSFYDAGMSAPSFPQVSSVPAFRTPDLRTPMGKEKDSAMTGATPAKAWDGREMPLLKESALAHVFKLASQATTARGRFHETSRVGLPRTTGLPGPSIAQVAKPDGYGRADPGCTKP